LSVRECTGENPAIYEVSGATQPELFNSLAVLAEQADERGLDILGVNLTYNSDLGESHTYIALVTVA
jgi:hypothetical protein